MSAFIVGNNAFSLANLTALSTLGSVHSEKIYGSFIFFALYALHVGREFFDDSVHGDVTMALEHRSRFQSGSSQSRV